MPMSTLESDTIAKACSVAKSLLADLQPRLAGLDSIYNSVGGVKETLTQDELDENPALSGLAKQTLDDAIFAMSGMLTSMTNAYAALAQVAARFV